MRIPPLLSDCLGLREPNSHGIYNSLSPWIWSWHGQSLLTCCDEMESSAHTQQLHKNEAEFDAWIENQICWEQTGSKESCAGELGYSQEGWTGTTMCVQGLMWSFRFCSIHPRLLLRSGQMLCRKIEY